MDELQQNSINHSGNNKFLISNILGNIDNSNIKKKDLDNTINNNAILDPSPPLQSPYNNNLMDQQYQQAILQGQLQTFNGNITTKIVNDDQTSTSQQYLDRLNYCNWLLPYLIGSGHFNQAAQQQQQQQRFRSLDKQSTKDESCNSNFDSNNLAGQIEISRDGATSIGDHGQAELITIANVGTNSKSIHDIIEHQTVLADGNQPFSSSDSCKYAITTHNDNNINNISSNSKNNDIDNRQQLTTRISINHKRRKARTVFADSQLNGLECRFGSQRYLSTQSVMNLQTS